jgi:hypothetical protein
MLPVWNIGFSFVFRRIVLPAQWFQPHPQPNMAKSGCVRRTYFRAVMLAGGRAMRARIRSLAREAAYCGGISRTYPGSAPSKRVCRRRADAKG